MDYQKDGLLVWESFQQNLLSLDLNLHSLGEVWGVISVEIQFCGDSIFRKGDHKSGQKVWENSNWNSATPNFLAKKSGRNMFKIGLNITFWRQYANEIFVLIMQIFFKVFKFKELNDYQKDA